MESRPAWIRPLPPRPSRLYWACQFAGWGGFTAYVLAGYLIFSPEHTAGAVLSIVGINGAVCPALTHGLRHWMYQRSWLDLGTGRLVLRLSVVVD